MNTDQAPNAADRGSELSDQLGLGPERAQADRLSTELPAELLAELRTSETRGGRVSEYEDSLTRRLAQLVKDAGVDLSVNHLLIGMYRRHGLVLKRKNVTTLMSHAVKLGLCRRIGNGVFGPNAELNGPHRP